MRTSIWDAIGALLEGAMSVLAVGGMLFGLVMAALVVWAVCTFFRRLRESEAVHRSWPRTEATVTEVTSSSLISGEPPLPLARYSYQDANGVSRSALDDGRALAKPAVGQRIRIAYDPHDPTASHPLVGIRGRIVTWAVLFGTVIVLLAACSALLLMLGIDHFLVH